MKKKLLIAFFAVISALCLAFGLSACGGKIDPVQPSCQHEFEYIYDDDFHYGLCINCGDETQGAHVYSGNVCSVCGYVKEEGKDEPGNTGKTVAFNPNGGYFNDGGTSVITKNYEPGEPMTELPVPTRKGYNFICWEDSLGIEFNETSIMPNTTLSLKARWEKVVSKYEDEYVIFKPATEGKKQDEINYLQCKGIIQKYVYIELTSDDFGGAQNVGKNNNFDLTQNEELFKYEILDKKYGLAWFRDIEFSDENGGGLFTLNYGSNFQYVTVTENKRPVRRYLLDIYVKHDYYVSLYKNIFEEEPYDKVRVIENEKFPADTKAFDYENGFEFDKRVYLNEKNGKYEQFPNIAITQNWNLYQTYKPLTLSADLDNGTLNEELKVTPYTQSFTLPSSEKEGYDFLGWQLSNGKFITNIEGYSGENYISKENFCDTLKAVYGKKKFYYTFENDTLQTFKTVPVVTYTDKTCTKILEVVYVPYNTDCVLPVKTAQTEDTAFSEWKYYSKNAKGEYIPNPSIYEFNRKITSPVALFPETVSGNSHNTIPLNAEKTYKYQDTYTAYLPVGETYKLNVSTTGSVTLKLSSAQNTYQNSYTATAGNPVSIDVACYAYELGEKKNIGGYVTVTVTSLSGTFTASLNGATAKTDGNPAVTNESNTVEIGEEFTPEMEKLSQGYTFDGWYNGDTKISDKCSVTMKDKEFICSAKWTVYTLTTEADNTAAGTVSKYIEKKITAGDEVIVTATTNIGYTFIGWYDGETKLTDDLSYTFAMPAKSVTYTAKWIKVTIEVNNKSAGTVTNLTEKYKAGDEVTVTAETNNGYTFVGWFNGKTKLTDNLSYTFAMPTENVTYTAMWCKITVTSSDWSIGTVTGLNDKYKVGDEVTVTASPKTTTIKNSNRVFIGWFDGETKLSSEYEYTFLMPTENTTVTAKWCLINYKSDNTTIGTVTLLKGTFKSGEEVTITTEPKKEDCVFDGWYIEEKLITRELSYSFIMNAETLTYTAKWLDSPIKFDTNIVTAGYLPKLSGMYKIGEKISVSTKTYLGYEFLGWFKGEELMTKEETLSFELTREQTVYTAKWFELPEMQNFNFSSTTEECIVTGLKNKTVKELTIPDIVTAIGSQAFYACSSLESIAIPDSVTEIGAYAFVLCTNLKKVFISDLFAWCSIFFGGEGFSGGGSTIFSPCNPLCYGAELYINNELTIELVIPEGITNLSANFKGCTSIKSVIIPDGLTSIGDNAFRECSSLEIITIPDSVTNIGSDAFYGCSKLQYYEFDNAYYLGNTTNNYLVLVKAKAETITSCTINEDTKIIYDYVFSNCISLTSVTIPDGVISIGENAFWDCSSLKSITFRGTQAQWNAIEKENGWDSYAGDYTVHCSDGDLSKSES